MKIERLCAMLLISLGFFLQGASYAQGWERFDAFTPVSGLEIDLCYANDSSVMVLSTDTDDTISGQSKAAWLRKIDTAGNLVWEKKYRSGFIDEGVALQPLNSGGYAMVVRSLDSSYTRHYYLYRLDNQGDTLWTRKSFEGDWQDVFDVTQTLDENLVVLIQEDQQGALGETLVLAKYNLQGDTLWKKSHPFMFNTFYKPDDVLETADSTLWVSSHLDDQDLILHCEADGDTLWTRQFPTGGLISLRPLSLVPGPQGGVVYHTEVLDTVPPVNVARPSLVHLDTPGNEVWRVNYTQHLNYRVRNLISQPGGGYVLVGHYSAGPNGLPDLSLMYVDPAGTWQFTRDYGTLFDESGYDLLFTNYGPIYAVGTHFTQSANGNSIYMLKTSASGSVQSNQVLGRIFDDLNGNCILDPGEPGLPGWVIKLEPGPLWAISDSMGNYTLPADTGAFTLETQAPHPYRTVTCPINPSQFSGNFSGQNQTQSGYNFATQATDSCPHLWVDVASARLNHDRPSEYVVMYRNLGTVPENNVTVTVTLDPKMVLDSAAPNWTLPQNDNIYQFGIGTLAPGQSGSIRLFAFLHADSAARGLTHCVRAEIDPHTACQVIDPNWDNSSYTVKGECLHDTVRFTITNEGIGSAVLVGGGGLLVHEDDILSIQSNFTLGYGQDTVIAIPGNGSTWTCRVAQTPGHPGQSFPRAYVEACSTNQFGGYTTGIVNHFPEDDLDDWVSELCLESVGVFNLHKTIGFPMGLFTQRFIAPNRRIEYQSNYENTRTAIVEDLVIRTQLPTNLNLFSFTKGAALHPYVFTLTPRGTAEWHFNDINLTDSLTSLTGSMTVANFRLNQFPNMPGGTVYTTRPTYTFNTQFYSVSNTSFHTLQDSAFGVVTVSRNPDLPSPLAGLKVYPNPFRDHVFFELPESVKGTAHLEVFDLTGRQIITHHWLAPGRFKLERKEIPSGLYLFRVTKPAGLIGSGRIQVW